MPKKVITPKDPQVKDEVADDADKSAERKTAVSFRGRKVARKTAATRGNY